MSLKDKIYDALLSGNQHIIDKEIDPECNGITHNSLRFWDELKNIIDVDEITYAEMLHDDVNWSRLVLEDIGGRRFYFYGLASGYVGTGARGTERVLREAGFSEEQIKVVFQGATFQIYK